MLLMQPASRLESFRVQVIQFVASWPIIDYHSLVILKEVWSSQAEKNVEQHFLGLFGTARVLITPLLLRPRVVIKVRESGIGIQWYRKHLLVWNLQEVINLVKIFFNNLWSILSYMWLFADKAEVQNKFTIFLRQK